MNNKKKSALVLGATGLIGGHLLEYLLADETYEQVTTIGRRSVPWQDRKLKQIQAQVEDVLALPIDAGRQSGDELSAAFRVQNKKDQLDIFCTLGTTMKKAGSRAAFERIDFEYPLHAARLGLAGGARQFFIVTSMGADVGSLIYYNRIKGKIEDHLHHLQYHSIQIFRPSLLIGERHEQRTGEDLGKALGSLIGGAMIGPLRKYKPIEARIVARAMLRMAHRADSGIHTYESDRIQELGR